MPNSKVTAWLVAFATHSVCLGTANADDSVHIRLIAEAKLFFRSVLADEPPAQHCELEPTWQRYSLPESVAREFFGLKAHAELSTPFLGSSLIDILDLPADKELACSNDRAKSIEGEQLKDYEASKDKRLLIFRRTGYTFPVFSDDYESAALVISHSARGWTRMPDGIESLRTEGVGYVAIYKKVKGAWQRVATVELFAS